MNNQNEQNRIILLFSGKRKSGKDFTCSYLIKYIQEELDCFNLNIITLSSPIKEEYAKQHNLNYEKLLDSTDYKEKYRLDMINWSDSVRKNDPSYFCRKAVEKSLKETHFTNNKTNLWIITDMRRRTDLTYFSQTYLNQTKTVRVIASDESRKARNWIYTIGVDDGISECDLDSLENWDYLIYNNNDVELKESLQDLLSYLKNFKPSS